MKKNDFKKRKILRKFARSNAIFMVKDKIRINVWSEIGNLDAVLLHPPGAEVENMTPRNVQRALYSDILNLSIAQGSFMERCPVLRRCF